MIGRLLHRLRSVEWVDVTLLATVAVLLVGAMLSSCGRGG